MAQQRRDYSLDNLKWVLTVLVLLHHTAALCGLDYFLYNLPHLGPQAGAQYDLLKRFQAFNQGYFMSLFFFISAIFVPASLAKKGADRFFADKLKRFGIPVALTVIVILPLSAGIAALPDGRFAAGVLGFYRDEAKGLAALNPLFGVAWFIWTLLVFSTVYMLIVKWRGPKPIKAAPKRRIPPNWQIALFACAMIPVNYGALALQQVLGENILGFHLLKYFPMYIAMFTFGIVASRHDWLNQLTMKTVLPWAFVAILALVWRDLGEMITRPFTVIGMSMLMLYGFRQAFTERTPLTQWLTDAAYAAYLIQTVTISLVGVMFVRVMTDSPMLNFVITSVAAVPLSFVVAHYLRKLPGLRHIL